MNNQSIKSLKIKNFRSYKSADIKFHPGLNIITGANDSGKSNLLRVINLIVQNQPSSDDYISDHGGDMDLQMEVGNRTVGRFRNSVWNKKEGKYKAGTENLYTLAGEPEPFRSFGRGNVPEVISQHLNINPVNIAFQLDSPFLLGKSPAEVARYYNSLVNLEVIDKAISNIASTLRREKGDLKVEQALVEKKTEELKKYDWLKNAEKELNSLEKLNNYLKHLNAEWSALAGWIKQLQELYESNQKLSEITKHKKVIDTLVIKNEKILGLTKDYNELHNLIDTLHSFKMKNERLKETIQHKGQVNELIEQSKEIDELINQEEILEKYIQELKELKGAEKQYADIIKHRDKAVKQTILSEEIDELISKYNLLYDSLETRIKLDNEQKELDDKLVDLKAELGEALEDGCPLCERSCDCGNKEVL